MKPKDIPIIIFTYNRLDHTKITLDTLVKNKGFGEHPVTIYSDGSRPQHEESVLILRKYLEEFTSHYSNVKLVKREKNLGLAKSIIAGVTEALNNAEAVIVIEDDIRTSPTFLEYMVDMLVKYKDENKVGSISGYSHSSTLMNFPKSYIYDIYFIPRTSSWGWGTWRNRWEDVDWKINDFEDFLNDRKKQRLFNIAGADMSRMLIRQVTENVDTWDIQWAYHNFKKGRLTIYPSKSYVENVGHDGTGIHCLASTKFVNTDLNEERVSSFPMKVEVDKFVLREFRKTSTLNIKTFPLYIELIISKILQILKR